MRERAVTLLIFGSFLAIASTSYAIRLWFKRYKRLKKPYDDPENIIPLGDIAIMWLLAFAGFGIVLVAISSLQRANSN
jgi:hypothetical protein